MMRKTLIGLAALAGLAMATPASAAEWNHHHYRHWHGGPSVGVTIGAPGAYAYSRYHCDTIRERHVDRWGNVHYRRIERC
jgi:hypothetical protein